MLENLIKKTLSYGSALLLAASINCGESNYETYDPIINNVSYTSNSAENSLNHWFVTGEDIDVYATMNEPVDSAYINAERRFRGDVIKESYKMLKENGNVYHGIIPGFDDGGVLWFRVVVNQGDRIDSSRSKEEPVFIGENDAHNVVKNFCNERNTEFFDNCDYVENEKINYGDMVLTPDFNFNKVEGFILYENAIIEYVGEKDIYEFSLDEEDYLISKRIKNRYIYNLSHPDYPWNFYLNEITNKQDIENYVSNFYYGLLY